MYIYILLGYSILNLLVYNLNTVALFGNTVSELVRLFSFTPSLIEIANMSEVSILFFISILKYLSDLLY